jgi:hypothetical protein
VLLHSMLQRVCSATPALHAARQQLLQQEGALLYAAASKASKMICTAAVLAGRLPYYCSAARATAVYKQLRFGYGHVSHAGSGV